MVVKGTVYTWERSFTVEEVRAFALLSGDTGRHHVTPDPHGRLMVHGLLTMSIPTKIGGGINYILYELRMEFVRPVFTGDLVRCDVTIDEVIPAGDRSRVATVIVCRNQEDKEVMRGRTNGIILHTADRAD